MKTPSPGGAAGHEPLGHFREQAPELLGRNDRSLADGSTHLIDALGDLLDELQPCRPKLDLLPLFENVGLPVGSEDGLPAVFQSEQDQVIVVDVGAHRGPGRQSQERAPRGGVADDVAAPGGDEEGEQEPGSACGGAPVRRAGTVPTRRI